MWVAWVYLKLVKSYILVSYMMSKWKCVRKVLAKVIKLSNEARGSYMYHLFVISVSVHWKRCKWIESSLREFEEHNKWYVIICINGSFPRFPLNLGISKGNLVGIIDHHEECAMGSLVSLVKFCNLRVTMNGNWLLRFGGGYPR